MLLVAGVSPRGDASWVPLRARLYVESAIDYTRPATLVDAALFPPLAHTPLLAELSLIARLGFQPPALRLYRIPCSYRMSRVTPPPHRVAGILRLR